MQNNMKVCGIENWKVEHRGTICCYLRQGEADNPVVHLLHGNGFSALSLLALADALPANWTLLATDIPGHGGSALDNQDNPDWTRLADQVAVSLQARTRGPVIGIGHSMGGVLSLRMASRYPELFCQLVLLDPVLFPPALLGAQRMLRLTGLAGRLPLPRRARSRRYRWPALRDAETYLRARSLYARWHERALRGFLATGLRQTPAGVELACAPQWEAAIFASHPGDLWGDVKRLVVPTDIVVASEGFGFITPGAARAMRLNSRINIHAFNGSHCFPMESPAETAGLLLSCIDKQGITGR